jgi:hypothetical protein
MWVCILGLGLLRALHAQEAPRHALQTEDLLLERREDPGLHLFIRKYPDVASVMLTESTRDPNGRAPTHAYRSQEWNSVNDYHRRTDASDLGALWPLMDSSPETHPLLGAAFHIYIPPVIVYGAADSPPETRALTDGLYINIRTFSLSYANASGGFQDNPFTLKYSSPPPLRQDADPLPPDEEPAPPLPTLIPADPEPPETGEEEPVEPPEAVQPDEIPAEAPDEARADAVPADEAPEEPRTDTVPAEAPKEARTDEAPAGAVPTDAAPADEVPPDSIQADEGRAGYVPTDGVRSPTPPEPENYPLVIDARFGLSAFLPGPEGMLLPTLPLTNTYNPVGTITLARQFNQTLALVLEAERESLSLNRIIGRAAWDIGVVRIEAGPAMGLLNTETLDISPGLSLLLHLRLPAWNLSGLFRFDFPLGREPSVSGEYTQSYAFAALSYALPWTNLTLGMFERGSTVLDSRGILRIGRWIRYNLAAEFPLVPGTWGFRLELGYERLQWNYELFTPLDYQYFAVYAGLEASYTVQPDFLTLIAGLEAPVYPFVYPALLQNLDTPQAAFFGKISLGFRVILW